MQSQKYFADAVQTDPVMVPLHQTALYTIYFDHALQRCVLHASYTWGESGGGTGGTGLGVSVFNCNPQALKAHADRLRQHVENGTDYFELPIPKVQKSKPTVQKPKTQTPPPALASTPPTKAEPSIPTETKDKRLSAPPSISDDEPTADAPVSAPPSNGGEETTPPPMKKGSGNKLPAVEKPKSRSLDQPMLQPVY